MLDRSLARLLLALIAALLACVACAGTPALPALAPTQPAAQAPTAAPTNAPPTHAPPTTASPTQPPTATPAPTDAPPTQAPPTDTPAPTAAPQPAASYFVYPKPDGSLWRADGPGKPPIQIADPTEPGALLPWAAAPDGRTIVFVTGVGVWDMPSNQPSSLALWLVGSDGSNPHKVQDLLPPRGVDPTPGGTDAFNLLPALTSQQELAWSPDGGLLAFVSAHENQVDLYVAAPNGKVTRLTDTPELEQGPRWSPDGSRIAYRTTTGFGTGAGWSDVELVVTPRAGGKPLLVLDNSSLTGDKTVASIPDLLWIGPDMLVAGLWTGSAGKDELCAVTVSSGTVEAIFDEPYSALGWSESTRQLAIAGASETTIEVQKEQRLAPGLYTWMPGAGAAIKVIAGPVEALVWSTQGDMLAYTMASTGKRPGVGLWSLLMDGDLKHIADAPAQSMRWSPDSQLLVADSTVYGRDGKKLAALAGAGVVPAGWGPQGLFYFALAADGQARELWLWNGSQPQQLAIGLGSIERAALVLAKM